MVRQNLSLDGLWKGLGLKSFLPSTKGFMYFGDPTLTWWHCLYAAYRYRIIVSSYQMMDEGADKSQDQNESSSSSEKRKLAELKNLSAIKSLAWISKESPLFVKKYALASFLELLLYTFAHSWLTSICYGQPFILLSTDGPVLLCLLAWFLIFSSPFDMFFKILKSPFFQVNT